MSSSETISFLGIKIPEELGEHGKKSLVAYLNRKILKKRIRIVCDPSIPNYLIKDSNRNYRAYIYLEDETFINAELIKEGLAIVDYSFSYKYIKKLEELEILASEKKKGLWQIPTMEYLTWRTRNISPEHISAPEKNSNENKIAEENKIQSLDSMQSLTLMDSRSEKLKKYLDMLQPSPTTVNVQNSKIEYDTTNIFDNNKIKNKFVGHIKSKIYHIPKCNKIRWISNGKIYFDSVQQAEQEGYIADENCLRNRKK
ncbi:thermonuclease family protein [Candidatus Desantisbacteria bacterium]|nr:thermonuclease family protein [Candidatus Desantisbacteria bacterium]